MSEDKFRIVVTALIKNIDNRILITKRTASKKRWPNKWTVPGGNVTTKDFLGQPTKINNQWYDILENALYREVLEETGLIVTDAKYLCSIAVIDSIIISMTAELKSLSQTVVLQLEECDEYAWVSFEEAKSYDLIDGLLDEIDRATRKI